MPKDRPNLVYILADDMGYGDLSCLNPESKIRTRHIDRLAREGMAFTDAHATSAVCTPSLALKLASKPTSPPTATLSTCPELGITFTMGRRG